MGSIIRTSRDRWQAAQEWEWSIWQDQDHRLDHNVFRRLLGKLVFNRSSNNPDDWNYWWQTKFDDYGFLPFRLENVLELGCGPYTNIRLIGGRHKIRRTICSDPLITKYANLRNGWLARSVRRRAIQAVQHAAEHIPFPSGEFDCVIMINVLDHVYDAEACLQEAIRVTRTGGILVLGQDLTNDADMNISENTMDIGHPIRLHNTFIDQRVLHAFESIIYRVLPRKEGRAPRFHYGTYVYAGRKKPSPI